MGRKAGHDHSGGRGGLLAAVFCFGGSRVRFRLGTLPGRHLRKFILDGCPSVIVLILFTYVGRALRWQVMMRPFAPHANLGSSLRRPSSASLESFCLAGPAN